MDLSNLKGRIAEALVESIFRQAGYYVARVGRESHVLRLAKEGSDEFLPDFLAWKTVGREDDLHRLLTVEVKYRTDMAGYLRREAINTFSKVKEHWPDLYLILVSADPAPGCSCFQAMCLRDYTPSERPKLVDLSQLSVLDIYPSTIAEHERLAKRLFHELVRPSACGNGGTTERPVTAAGRSELRE